MQDQIRGFLKRLAGRALQGGRLLGQGCARLWRRAGFYIALAACLALVGGVAWYARLRPVELPPERSLASVPTAQAQPAGSEQDERLDEAQAARLSATPSPTPVSTPTPQPPPSFSWPVEGEVLVIHSPTTPIWSETLEQWQVHNGIDLSAGMGEIVRAPADGKITALYKHELMGNTIEITHDRGYVSRMCSLATLELVQVGDPVSAGQGVSAVGDPAPAEYALGSHLHLEVFKDGVWIDPLRLLP